MTQILWHTPASLIDEALEKLLPPPQESEERGLALLQNAMRYAVLGDGKRTRPLLLLEAFHATGGTDISRALHAACGVELIHAYSLVHDDLPSMDNSPTRRGIPSCHIQFGEGIAVLAGDALQTLAFESAANTGNARVVSLLAQAAGTYGMAGGQAIDIEWTAELDGLNITGDQLLHLHALKTGAMIRVAAEIGAVLNDCDEVTIEQMRQYGTHLGRAFQIWDDVLDVIGDPSVTGKGGVDSQNDKITATSIWGLEGAKKRALESSNKAIDALQEFGREADTLRSLANFVVSRNK
jgi:geranylgeranyl pyrophosphate synthase